MDKSKSLKSTLKFRGTPKGVLTNMYDAMRSRRLVEFSLKEFHYRFLTDKKFLRLYKEWIKSNKDKMKKPSLDRISNKKGYTVLNTQMLTWGENRYKQTMERRSRKGAVKQFLNGKLINRFLSQRDAVKSTGLSQGNISSCLNGRRNHCGGFVFIYENKDLIGET